MTRPYWSGAHPIPRHEAVVHLAQLLHYSITSFNKDRRSGYRRAIKGSRFRLIVVIMFQFLVKYIRMQVLNVSHWANEVTWMHATNEQALFIFHSSFSCSVVR